MLPTRQVHIPDARLLADLKRKYAQPKPLVWKKNHPEARGANASKRK